MGSIHVQEPDGDQEKDAGQDRYGDERHRPFRQASMKLAIGV